MNMNVIPFPSYVWYRNWRDEIPVLLSFIVNDGDMCSIADALVTEKWRSYPSIPKPPKTSSRTEAIQRIASLVEKPKDLFNRKMITRDVLFCYLTTLRPLVFAKQLKGTLEDMILEEWGFKAQDPSYVNTQQNIYNSNVNFIVNDLQNALQMLHI